MTTPAERVGSPRSDPPSSVDHGTDLADDSSSRQGGRTASSSAVSPDIVQGGDIEVRGAPVLVRWLIVLSVVAVLVELVGVYSPGSPNGLESQLIPGLDKVGHALMFGAPTFFIGWLLSWEPSRTHPGRQRRWWPVPLIFAAHGALSEVIQGFIPYRDPDVGDFTADVVGVVIAAVLLLALNRRRAS